MKSQWSSITWKTKSYSNISSEKHAICCMRLQFKVWGNFCNDFYSTLEYLSEVYYSLIVTSKFSIEDQIEFRYLMWNLTWINQGVLLVAFCCVNTCYGLNLALSVQEYIVSCKVTVLLPEGLHLISIQGRKSYHNFPSFTEKCPFILNRWQFLF